MNDLGEYKGTQGNWDQVVEQVWDQVGAQVQAQVWEQVWTQVAAQVRDQVWLQVRGYYK